MDTVGMYLLISYFGEVTGQTWLTSWAKKGLRKQIVMATYNLHEGLGEDPRWEEPVEAVEMHDGHTAEMKVRPQLTSWEYMCSLLNIALIHRGEDTQASIRAYWTNAYNQDFPW